MDGVKIMTFCMSVAWVWSDSKWAMPSSFHSTGIMAGLVLKLQSNLFVQMADDDEEEEDDNDDEGNNNEATTKMITTQLTTTRMTITKAICVFCFLCWLFNRPGVAGAVLQTPLSLPD